VFHFTIKASSLSFYLSDYRHPGIPIHSLACLQASQLFLAMSYELSSFRLQASQPQSLQASKPPSIPAFYLLPIAFVLITLHLAP